MAVGLAGDVWRSGVVSSSMRNRSFEKGAIPQNLERIPNISVVDAKGVRRCLLATGNG